MRQVRNGPLGRTSTSTTGFVARRSLHWPTRGWVATDGDQPRNRTTFSRASTERYDHTSSLVAGWTRRERTGCWSRRRESNPHFEAYGTPKVAVPSLRNTSLASPTNRTTRPFWRGHGTRTRTPALTTRRLSLRLCPRQMSRRPRTRIPPVIGPSGWTRTTTSRVKSPACCVDTTKGIEHWSEWRDSNPHLKAWKARRRPLPHIRIWFGLRVSNPFLRAGNAGCIPPHPGRTWTGVVHRPIDIRQLSKTPLECERPRSETELPQHLARAFFRASGQNKKALQGIALEGLVLKEYRAF